MARKPLQTENTAVVTALLEDLISRGLSARRGLLVILDGGKALAAGVRAVFGPLWGRLALQRGLQRRWWLGHCSRLRFLLEHCGQHNRAHKQGQDPCQRSFGFGRGGLVGCRLVCI